MIGARAGLRALITTALLSAIGACGTATPPPQHVVRFTEGDVEVAVSLTRSNSGAGDLTVRLRPTATGFHLYSTTHDADASGGLGVATAVELVGGLHAAGALRANAQPERLAIAILGTSVEVIPDGPVELTLPAYETGTPASVSLTYAACSASTCLAPVRDRLVELSAR